MAKQRTIHDTRRGVSPGPAVAPTRGPNIKPVPATAPRKSYRGTSRKGR